MRSLPYLIAAGMLALTPALPAAAQEKIEAKFSYDLEQPAAWNYAQIKKTAEDACEPRGDLTSLVGLYSRADESECRTDLISQAVTLFDIDELTTLHLSNASVSTLAATEIAPD